ncbi:helix-turn-helix transcriptional regulator [Simkania negevensis]|uniref:Helix-turn-helix transcriptional regulator n=1 Tax=Simkania negevensis TaxID=83561 RepID=A0ABS3AQJ9_9BACT|nr:helix-turn-helix transcriptional regulator [Simkania negevensis]
MTTQTLTPIAQFLRSVRKHLRLSQEKFAARLNITFPTISRWENGRAKPSPLGWEQVRKLVEEINQEDPGLFTLPDITEE